MTHLKLLSSLLSLQLLGPALRSKVAAFDVLMVIGKLSVNRSAMVLDQNVVSTQIQHSTQVYEVQYLFTVLKFY